MRGLSIKSYKSIAVNFVLLMIFLITNSFVPKISEFAPGLTSKEIIQTNDFSDILKYIKPNSLILIDIDDTLMEPKQTLGSDIWFQWRIAYYKEKGIDPKIAFEMGLMDWVAVQCLTDVQIVQADSDKILKQMQEEGFHVMGLTTRGASLATRTIQQLKTINIDLGQSAPSNEEKLFLNPYEVIYKNGILFTSGTHKGHALFKFLKLIENQFPLEQIEEVIFINDKASHLSQIQESCAEKGISFIGLRYGFSDQRVKSFSEEIALYQFNQFGKIISDAEAVDGLNQPE